MPTTSRSCFNADDPFAAADHDPVVVGLNLPKTLPETTTPTVTVKDDSVGSDGVYTNVSFKLFDAGEIDEVVLNGVTKDLTDNVWSDLDGVKPGVFGAKLGANTLDVFDVAGNKTTVTFTLLGTFTTSTPVITTGKNGARSGGLLTVDPVPLDRRRQGQDDHGEGDRHPRRLRDRHRGVGTGHDRLTSSNNPHDRSARPSSRGGRPIRCNGPTTALL